MIKLLSYYNIKFGSVLLFGLLPILLNPTSTQAAETNYPFNVTELVAPLKYEPRYPLTKEASISCGRWRVKSQDYPYFGAPRDKNTRMHAGVDIYPPEGKGAKVKALKRGTILKIAPFYTRANGEITYGMLIDHGDFVVNYAELQKPALKEMAVVKSGQEIGVISGTRQLHFELYSKYTKGWLRWFGPQPANLLDPTQLLIRLFSKSGGTK